MNPMLRKKWNRRNPTIRQRTDNSNLVEDFGIYNPMIPIYKNMEEERMKKYKFEKSVKLTDGKYTGKIEDVEFRHEPYEYTDVKIKENTNALILSYGVPTTLSEDSRMMNLLESLGIDIDRNIEYTQDDLEKFLKKNLIGRKVSFLVMNKTTEKGTFANITPDSVKTAK